MDINYITLIVGGVCFVLGALTMFVGIIVGGRMVYGVATGDGGLLVNQNHPEIVEMGEEDDDDPEIVNGDDD